MNPAAANRLNALVDQYPLYSKAGEALYEAGDSYSKMGPRFRKQAGEMFAAIVSEYPLSARVKERQEAAGGDGNAGSAGRPGSVRSRQMGKGELQNASMMTRSMGMLKGGPDVSHAAKSGAPTMTDPKRPSGQHSGGE